jgi:hypothetical protein
MMRRMTPPRAQPRSARAWRVRLAHAEARHPFGNNLAWGIPSAILLWFLGGLAGVLFAGVVVVLRSLSWCTEYGPLRRRFVRRYGPLPQWREYRYLRGPQDPDDRFLE